MHRIQGQNRLAGPAQGDHGFQGQSREPFKIREQIKLEALDSDEEEKQQPLAMASNSIFESFSSYQSCFSRGCSRGWSWSSGPAVIPAASRLAMADSGYLQPQAKEAALPGPCRFGEGLA
ncbi:hypothetical protein cypCar_00022258 [Cyprinus carpio]|nr:hypothetical protein cypCar_00022258 [Cyprinus carpio]